MKTVKIIIVALLAIVFGFSSIAQSQDLSKTTSIKTETLKVSGNCGMCKSRIEKAAKLDGVSKAEWNSTDKTLAVTYDPAKTNIDQIGKKLASVGHDNEKAKADDKIYNALPGCCKYR
ncbi:MAG: heavy-metal-associated domain-containing protein [Bacteroidia bacterium]|nr:heavy-metal-associated domain-containing protein [Bacteroidia bacterium]